MRTTLVTGQLRCGFLFQSAMQGYTSIIAYMRAQQPAFFLARHRFIVQIKQDQFGCNDVGWLRFRYVNEIALSR
jgi:hypothetical protein